MKWLKGCYYILEAQGLFGERSLLLALGLDQRGVEIFSLSLA